jgi:hypothetical protein
MALRNPLTYSVDALRGALIGERAFEFLDHLALAIAATVPMMFAA